jgi:hypothetical protein
MAAVLIVGTDTQVANVYGIESGKPFVNTLEGSITQRGAPHTSIRDSAHVIVSKKGTGYTTNVMH